MDDLLQKYERLQKILPDLERSEINTRTRSVWHQHWIDKYTVREIARDRGWTIPAIEWHLRRAHRLLE